MAFITSQGVLDAPTNAPIREYMMNHANLVGVARLPNNLFTDNAGTEVGSDLIILQRTAERTVNCITTKTLRADRTDPYRHFRKWVCMEHRLAFTHGFDQKYRPIRETSL